MKSLVVVLGLVALIACSVSVGIISLTAKDTIPVAAEAAPSVIREFRRTDTLDELQQFEAMERPSRPVWPFIMALALVIGVIVLLQSPSILKQFNSTLRQLKRRGGGRGRSSSGGQGQVSPPPQPIILPPNYGSDQRALPSGRTGETEW
ncbi:MAG: hypothetical protein KC441_02480 [Anaerolineales bacterium]|nr:hypothetical protein [Anaerolineales bacterium]